MGTNFLRRWPEQVEDPPEIESMDDEILLLAWKDKTLAEMNELVHSPAPSTASGHCTAPTGYAGAVRPALLSTVRDPPSPPTGGPACLRARQKLPWAALMPVPPSLFRMAG